MAKTRTRVSGPVAVEDEPTGDGRLYTRGCFQWDGVLPAAIVFDLEEGDHSAAVVGQLESLERRHSLTGPTVIWGDGYLEDSDVEEAQAFVERARELLASNPAVGVSLRYDSEVCEIRVKAELLQAEEEMPLVPDQDGRVTVMKFAADDALQVTTSCRVRHLAIVDTAAMLMPDGERFAIAASGFIQTYDPSVAASALAGDWSGHEWMFADPKFGDITNDPRLRYDPERGLWSCPPTLTDDGHYFGHITPMGICLRGRPDRCVTPPDGDLEGFMRGRAPAAGGLRTGVVTVVDRGQHGHCQTGIGVLAATQFYDGGWGAADVRVGRDQYGIWFSGMARPGITQEQAYQLCSADVSGHWEYPLHGVRNRATLVGLPAVDVGGFPKGYLTYQEFAGGLAASAGIAVDEGCGAWITEETIERSIELTLESDVVDAIFTRLDNLTTAIGDLYAAHITKTADGA